MVHGRLLGKGVHECVGPNSENNESYDETKYIRVEKQRKWKHNTET